MDGRTDEWMDGWISEGWMDKSMDRWMNKVRLDEGIEGKIVGWICK